MGSRQFLESASILACMLPCLCLQTFSIADAEMSLSGQKNFHDMQYLQICPKQLQTKRDIENAMNCIYTFLLKSNRKTKLCNEKLFSNRVAFSLDQSAMT